MRTTVLTDTMNNHTPEPWSVFAAGGCSWVHTQRNPDKPERIPQRELALMKDKGEEGFANAARVVACVNGCKGIQDPETTVTELVEFARFIVSLNGGCPPADTPWPLDKARAILEKISNN
jgi:hypothetical protein